MKRENPADMKAKAKKVASNSASKREAPRQSLRDQAYKEIKRLIIICKFKPGSYLNEAQVSELLGTGRTPVHQAILQLMHEDLVEIIPRKGVIVKPISFDEVLQIIEIRLLLEVHCVRLAAMRADESDIAALRGILNSSAKWVNTNKTEQMMMLDRDFHIQIANISRMPVLAEILRKLHDRSLRFWFLSLNQPHHHQAVQEQHEKIVKAIAAKNPNAAEQAMRAHIESTRRNIGVQA